MSNQFQLAKKLIKESRDIFIIPSKTKQEESMSDALALFYSLKKIGKNVNLLANEIPLKIKFLTCLSQQQLIVSINTKMREVSEIRYEKGIKKLKIYLSTKNGRINSQDISFIHQGINNSEEKIFKKEICLKDQSNIFILLGENKPGEITLFYKNKNIKDFKEIFKTQHLGFAKEMIINNIERYFDKISLDKSTVSLTGTLTEIIKTMGSEVIDKNIATCLLTSLILKTKNFHYSHISPQYFAFANFLIEKGADYQEIVQELYLAEENISEKIVKTEKTCQEELFKRTLEKLKFQGRENFYFVSLNNQDFQDTQSKPKDLIFVIKKLRQDILSSCSWLFLWKPCFRLKLIQGVFWSKDKNRLKKVLNKFQGSSKGYGVLFSVQERNVKIVQDNVLKLISSKINEE